MANFNINIEPANDVIAVADSYTIVDTSTISCDILSNDLYNVATLDQILIEVAPSNGTALVNGNNIDYTPNSLNTDSFSYKLVSTNGSTSVATVNILID